MLPQANRALQLLPSGRSGAWKITTSQPITSSAQNWLVKKLIFTQPLLGTSEGKLPKQPRGPQGAGQGGQQGPQSWQQGSQQEGGGQQLGAQPGRQGSQGSGWQQGSQQGSGGQGQGVGQRSGPQGSGRQQGLGEQVERSGRQGVSLPSRSRHPPQPPPPRGWGLGGGQSGKQGSNGIQQASVRPWAQILRAKGPVCGMPPQGGAIQGNPRKSTQIWVPPHVSANQTLPQTQGASGPPCTQAHAAIRGVWQCGA